MSEWKKMKLGELYEVHNGLSKGRQFFGSGYPFLSFSTVFNNWFLPDSLDSLVQSSEKEREACSIKRGDVFVTRTSETMDELGMSSVALKDYPNATYNGFTKRLRPIGDSVLPEYIGYYLRSPKFRGKFMAFSTMTTRASLANGDLLSMEVELPEKEVQHRIATILSRYDTLIENYQKQIKLLEEAAQRLYKEWFVDLRFPGYENVKMVDGLPEGWERKKLGEVVTKSIGGGWGKETPQEKYDRDGYVIRGTDISKLKNGSLNEIPFRYHTESNLKERTLSEGDIIFEVSGGSEKEPVGRMYLVTQPILDYYCKDVICASFCKKVSFTNNMISMLCYFAMQHCRNTGDMKKFEKDSAGNIINFAWTNFLEDFNVLLPNNEMLNAFYKRANAIINSEVKLSLQIRLLTEARDRLLPRLMGGEMDGLKGQRANSPAQRSGRNEEYEQPTNAPKRQKN